MMSKEDDQPIVLLFHGSRKAQGNTSARLLKKKFSASLPLRRVESAFLQFSKPSLESILRALATESPRRIIILPLILFKGKHLSEEVESTVSRVKRDFPIQRIVIADEIASSPLLLEILHSQLKQCETPSQQQCKESITPRSS